VREGTKERGDTRTFAVEEPGAVFSRKGEALRKFPDELDDLGGMVFILGVPRPRLRVEEVIPAREEFE